MSNLPTELNESAVRFAARKSARHADSLFGLPYPVYEGATVILKVGKFLTIDKV